MSKRRAAYELTRENCEDDDIVEEAGEFVTASQTQLEQRVIKVAKRKIPSSGTSNRLFDGFKFGAAATSADTVEVNQHVLASTTTGFTSTCMTTTTSQSSLNSDQLSFGNASGDKKMNGFATKDSFSKVSSTIGNQQEKQDADKIAQVSNSSEDAFYSRLSTLNRNLVTWIQQHVDENPMIDLTPVFQDYFKHIKELEKLKPVDEIKESKPTTRAQSDTAVSAVTEASPISIASPVPVFDWKSTQKTEAPTPVTTAPASFGFTFDSQNAQSSFFSVASPLSFGTASTEGCSSSQGQDDDNEPYVPPVVESVQLEEQGSVYSKLCKLFSKTLKDTTYRDRGKGMLHLKPSDDGKTQLLIRADTTLGNVLLNILLSESMPCARSGKNNISLVCVPNPPLDPKQPSSEPATMLIRVRDTTEADDLFAQIEKYKKSQ